MFRAPIQNASVQGIGIPILRELAHAVCHGRLHETDSTTLCAKPVRFKNMMAARGILIARGLVVVVAGLAVAGVPAVAKTCGTESWEVKTLSDSSAGQVSFSGAIKTTIDELTGTGKWKHYKHLPVDSRFAEEFKANEVEGIIIFVAHEDDRDHHIALSNPGEPTPPDDRGNRQSYLPGGEDIRSQIHAG